MGQDLVCVRIMRVSVSTHGHVDWQGGRDNMLIDIQHLYAHEY